MFNLSCVNFFMLNHMINRVHVTRINLSVYYACLKGNCSYTRWPTYQLHEFSRVFPLGITICSSRPCYSFVHIYCYMYACQGCVQINGEWNINLIYIGSFTQYIHTQSNSNWNIVVRFAIKIYFTQNPKMQLFAPCQNSLYKGLKLYQVFLMFKK